MKTIVAFFVAILLCSLNQNTARAQILISEYVEGSGNNKALELWNISPTNVTFGTNAGELDVRLAVYANGSSSPTATISLTPGFTLPRNGVFVLANPSAIFATNADQTSASATWNGDDALVLLANGTILDSIGQVGFDPGLRWGTAPNSTADNTLRRVPFAVGDVNVSDAYDPAVEFQGFVTDTFDDLGASPVGPLLEVQPSGAQVVLSWSALPSGYQLQSATNLPATVWSNTTLTPIVINNRRVVTNDSTSRQEFYRLRK